MNPNEPVPYKRTAVDYPSWRNSDELTARAARRRQMRAVLGRPERVKWISLQDATSIHGLGSIPDGASPMRGLRVESA